MKNKPKLFVIKNGKLGTVTRNALPSEIQNAEEVQRQIERIRKYLVFWRERLSQAEQNCTHTVLRDEPYDDIWIARSCYACGKQLELF